MADPSIASLERENQNSYIVFTAVFQNDSARFVIYNDFSEILMEIKIE